MSFSLKTLPSLTRSLLFFYDVLGHQKRFTKLERFLHHGCNEEKCLKMWLKNWNFSFLLTVNYINTFLVKHNFASTAIDRAVLDGSFLINLGHKFVRQGPRGGGVVDKMQDYHRVENQATCFPTFIDLEKNLELVSVKICKAQIILLPTSLMKMAWSIWTGNQGSCGSAGLQDSCGHQYKRTIIINTQ